MTGAAGAVVPADPILAAAFWIGLAALFLTLLLALQIVRLRLALRKRQRREARAMLGRRARPERLLATLLLGHLRDHAAWPQLQRVTGSGDTALALTALWALVRIDPRAAAAYLAPLFVERDDWAMSHVAGILKEGADPVAAVLLDVLPTLPRQRLPRALRIEVPPDLLARALDDEDVAVLRARAAPA